MNGETETEADLFTEDVVLMFHSRSRDAAPGRGAGEQIADGLEPAYAALAAIADWRKLLSNFADSPFTLDGLRWRSVEHCFQAHKFRELAPDYFRSFALDSGSELANSLGASVKKAGGRRAHPLDAAARAEWEGRKFIVQERALFAKFSQRAEHRAALLATRDAKLTHRPARSPRAIVEIGLMRVRKRLARGESPRG